MEEKLNLNQLLQKPIAMMTGEELCFLYTRTLCSLIENTLFQYRKVRIFYK